MLLGGGGGGEIREQICPKNSRYKLDYDCVILREYKKHCQLCFSRDEYFVVCNVEKSNCVVQSPVAVKQFRVSIESGTSCVTT